MSRQQQRAALRTLSSAVLKRLVNLPRSIRRTGARAYATQGFRDVRKLPLPVPRHRYRKVHLNPMVRQFIGEQA